METHRDVVNVTCHRCAARLFIFSGSTEEHLLSVTRVERFDCIVRRDPADPSRAFARCGPCGYETPFNGLMLSE